MRNSDLKEDEEMLNLDEREFILSGREFYENSKGMTNSSRKIEVRREKEELKRAMVSADKYHRKVGRPSYGQRVIERSSRGKVLLPEAKKLIRTLAIIVNRVGPRLPRKAMSPALRVLHDQARRLLPRVMLSHPDKWLTSDVESLERFFLAVRRAIATKAFARLRDSFSRLSRKNRQSFQKRLEKIAKLFSRILAIRIDLSYLDQLGKDVSKQEALASFWAVIEQVQENLKHWIYWARKMEYGVETGYHIHFLLVLNADKHSRGITIGERLGQFWSTIATGNKGKYWNCNRDEQLYAHRGIGLIRTDSVEFDNLRTHAGPYLVKGDYYFKSLRAGRAFSQSKVQRGSKKSPSEKSLE